MDRVEKGLKDRLKKTQAIRMLGTGMDVGDLNDYAHEICLLLLLKIFRREITENPNRTRQDLIYMTEEILREMDFAASKEVAERLVDGVLWYKDPNRQDPFSCYIFDEETRTHELYKFRYLKPDREHSQWEKGGSTVYMLTEEAQEIIFITREILEEFGFDIEQFYTLQLIKSGNFNKAQNSVSNLIARVRTLIRREKDYRQDVLRNPQIIFMDSKNSRRKSEDEIKRQFEDEKKVFEDMFSWKNRLNSFPAEARTEAEQVFESLEVARALHDVLAKLVVENMAFEVEIRVKYPDSFWKTSNLTFKKDIWQNIIDKKGLANFDVLESLLNPLFSPEVDFIYPLEWAWEEQKIKKTEANEEIYEDFDEEETWQPKSADWDIIVELWEDIFDELMKNNEFSITELQDIDSFKKQKWLMQKKNIELFMMFVVTEVELKLEEQETNDDRLELFRRLCDKNPKYKKLIGRRISSVNEEDKEPLRWEELYVSPYKIKLLPSKSNLE
ncbi:hypothetical protein TSYNTROOL_15260 [Tepidanaerobacter syntrophicus]|uniref:hypothetical protein n=1 Tax=Tepidanaerobacter syntrophicus TaxID=224999 RepID=UPI001BD28818|nr:hypothetical protein [Tepidanaerobacter syntrophicus]GLI51440.1 hypothetical protein TSYNTROOL_15260 [Tepidanaerobacter syntrophicus]